MTAANHWLRLWHEMPNDPKWRTIARISSQPISFVLSVYLHLLVDASRNVTRGHATVTPEDIASALDVTEDAVQAILDAMQGRVLSGMHLLGWDKRQPKREDSGNENTGAKSAAQRKKEQREREREAIGSTPRGAECHAESRDVTLRHAESQQRREEKRREEETPAPSALVGSPPDGADTDPPAGQVVQMPSRVPCPAERLVEAFHEACPSLPRVMALNDTRRRHLAARWREVDADAKLTSADDGIEIFRAVFARVNKSDFLCGRTTQRGGRTWQASFDWLILPTNFLKVCEGHYENDRRSAM